MPDWVEDVVLWLLVVDLGVTFGAGVYESRFEIPRWKTLATEQWTNTGLKFWAFVTTGPLTLLTIVSFALVWTASGTRHDWWLASTILLVAERLLTFGYFIPTMARLQSSDGWPRDRVERTLSQWMSLNFVRHLLVVVTWLTALRAFTTIGD